jgi:UDP-N-acetylmuramoyl-tripeptide--D-alanyl-D-alanine ligase
MLGSHRGTEAAGQGLLSILCVFAMLRSPTIAECCQILGAKPLLQNGILSEAIAALPIAQVSTDSRSLARGDLFVALRGDRFDGHGFVAFALEQGAIAVVVDPQYELTEAIQQQAETQGAALLQVRDTLAAYQTIGQWCRQTFTEPVIAVTGSVGKTTTKELLAAVLGTQGPVLKTEANFNNEIGVPKTLLGLGPNHRYAVIEMGMRGRGQIAELAAIAQPTIGVISNVGTAHIELLGSEQAIAEAKCELLAEMAPTGLAVLNADCPRLITTAADVWSGRTVTYGLDSAAINPTDLRGDLQADGSIVVNGMRFELPLAGRHNALNFLAALAVARELGIDWAGLTTLNVQLPGGRSRRLEKVDRVLLDETYNAGLESMLAALRLLADEPGTRRIAVLGTMRELGDYSLAFHGKVGQAVAELGLDRLLILADSPEAAALVKGAGAVPTQCFDSHDALTSTILAMNEPGDRLLFKASRAVALDRVVEAVWAGLTDC